MGQTVLKLNVHVFRMSDIVYCGWIDAMGLPHYTNNMVTWRMSVCSTLLKRPLRAVINPKVKSEVFMVGIVGHSRYNTLLLLHRYVDPILNITANVYSLYIYIAVFAWGLDGYLKIPTLILKYAFNISRDYVGGNEHSSHSTFIMLTMALILCA